MQPRWLDGYVLEVNPASRCLVSTTPGTVVGVNQQTNRYDVRFGAETKTLAPDAVVPAGLPIVPLTGEELARKRVQAELDPFSVSPQLLGASGVRLARAATLCVNGIIPAPWMTLEQAAEEEERRASELGQTHMETDTTDAREKAEDEAMSYALERERMRRAQRGPE